MANDYYLRLGVEPDASSEEIKKAYRLRAKQYHPDVNGDDPKKTEVFKEITEAYDVLCDPEKRRLYDMLFRRNPSSGMMFSGIEGIDLADFLRAFFEQGPHMRGMGCRGRGMGRCGRRGKI